ncbi:MAG: S-methyl-5'-thioadenosine phosphorylase, partial [Thermoplasmata archaeon]
MRVGIVSGHNIPEITEGFEEISVETRFGKIDLLIGEYRNKEVVFLNRHQGRLPPHRINYLANVEAMKLSKVDSIFSFGTVGSLNPNIRPGFLVIPDDFIDFTKNRRYSFFDDSRTHID